ncbi:MAG TPA: ElyC/SanA/YdcF family protein [Polyangiaceae bacterium]|nr:ElyC/SanA/YdcF family protein [Polyangiaceae bacterium]
MTFDVLVVLGCRVQGGQLSQAALRRVERAARAYREDGSVLVVASGGKAWQGARECEVFAEGLVARGVPAAQVLQERESLTTRGNARGVAELLRDKAPRRVGIVTCDWHMPRALRLFRRVGFDPIAVPATSPPRSLHVTAARSVRERVSLALDLLFAPLWLLLLLALVGCSKPSDNGVAPAASSSGRAPSGSSSAASLSLLQAEIRRDPGAVPEDDLVAPSAERRTAALRSLARIQDPKSFEQLSRALADEAPSAIVWAAFGTGQLCRGHEPEAVRHLAMRAASLASEPVTEARDQAMGAIALALGRCASDEAEKTLRSWLRLRTSIAEAAALGLGQVARVRKRLDDATIAALLDAAAKNPRSSSLYPMESLPTLGSAARERLLEVASSALSEAQPWRAFAVRALAKGGPGAAPVLSRLIEADTTTDAERADAARALAALGAAGQQELGAALKSRSSALIEGRAWKTTQYGVVLSLLEALEPKRGDPGVLAALAQYPWTDEPGPVLHRIIALRCRAAALLAGSASQSARLLECDPRPPAEAREGSLALLKVLSRGPLGKGRGARFQELARSEDPVVREAALELLGAHDEVPNIPELLASALSAKPPGVRATAAKLLARYPARAQAAVQAKGDDEPAATPPTDPRVVQALTQQLGEVATTSNNIELSAWLLDAAAALELLGGRPAFERACASANSTLREHAERGFAALGEPKRHCPAVPGSESWTSASAGDFRLDFTTDLGPLSITLKGDQSPFAVMRFVELARAGFYDGMLIHRVVPGFVVQLGDPDGDGFGGPDLPPLRCQVSTEPFDVGSVGVALAGRDTGLSQLFVTLRRAPHLTGEYSLIGQAEPGWDKLTAGDRILKVTVTAL